MTKDTFDTLNGFQKANENRRGFLEEHSTSRREFLRNTGLMAAGFSLAGGSGLFKPTMARADGWTLKAAAEPYKGTTIRVSNIAGFPGNDYMMPFVPEFEAETGIKVEVDTVTYGEAVGKHLQLLATESTDYDLYNIDTVWFPGYAPYMEPLTDFMNNPKLADPNFAYGDIAEELQKTCSYLDKPYMFSNMFCFPIIAYRKDWYDAAGLKAPLTWSELYNQAKGFTKDGNYGYVIHGQRTAMLEMITVPYLSMGGSVFDDYLHPTFSQPPENFANSQRAMQFLRDIYQNKITPSGSLDFELGEAAAAYMQGNIAMNINWSLIFAVEEDPAKSKVAGKNGYCWAPTGWDKPQPNGEVVGGYSRLGCMGDAIPKFSENKEAAYLFSQWLSSPATQEKILLAGDSSPSRISLLKKYTDRQGHFPILLEAAQKVGKKVYDLPKIANEAQWEDAVALVLQDCMIGKIEPAEAMVKIDKDVAQLMRQYGYYDGDKEYPKSVTSNHRGTPKVDLLG